MFSVAGRGLAGPAFCFSLRLQSLVLHLRSVFIFSFFLFSTSMLVAKQVGNHASTYFIFWYFCIYVFFCLYHLYHDDVGKYICSHV